MANNYSCFKQKQEIKKGIWSPEEDEKLFSYITTFGLRSWSSLPPLAGLQRCGKSCRLRWMNYLRPGLKRGNFSHQEQEIILGLHQKLGNRWSQIAAKLPGRTDNEVKNFWNSCLKKKLIKKGVDPTTHKPIFVEKETSFAYNQANIFPSSSPSSSSSSMAMPAELEQAFYLNNNGELTVRDNFETSNLVFDQYDQMKYESAFSNFDFSKGLTSRMDINLFIRESLSANMIKSYSTGLYINNTNKYEACKELQEVQVTNAGDYPMGWLSEDILGEYFNLSR